jgi:hypothetical protein
VIEDDFKISKRSLKGVSRKEPILFVLQCIGMTQRKINKRIGRLVTAVDGTVKMQLENKLMSEIL